MNVSDKLFIITSSQSGQKYGYPDCCIGAFCANTPSAMAMNGATKEDKLRYKASLINGVYSGFIPCYNHALQVLSGKIKLNDLIQKSRSVSIPFPNDWTLK